jgi:hypothetical protein
MRLGKKVERIKSGGGGGVDGWGLGTDRVFNIV